MIASLVFHRLKHGLFLLSFNYFITEVLSYRNQIPEDIENVTISNFTINYWRFLVTSQIETVKMEDVLLVEIFVYSRKLVWNEISTMLEN